MHVTRLAEACSDLRHPASQAGATHPMCDGTHEKTV
jgi:3-methyladenine DNA glycosylase AlkC